MKTCSRTYIHPQHTHGWVKDESFWFIFCSVYEQKKILTKATTRTRRVTARMKEEMPVRPLFKEMLWNVECCYGGDHIIIDYMLYIVPVVLQDHKNTTTGGGTFFRWQQQNRLTTIMSTFWSHAFFAFKAIKQVHFVLHKKNHTLCCHAVQTSS